MDINMMNQSHEKRWNRYKKDFQIIADRCAKVLSLSSKLSVSVIFVDAKAIQEINRDYRNIDRPTDVISFALKDSEDAYEMLEGEEELGDIFINVKAVVDQSHAYGHSIRREVCFLFVHGLLHLCGYDHMEEREEKEMFALQDVILNEIVPKKNHS